MASSQRPAARHPDRLATGNREAPRPAVTRLLAAAAVAGLALAGCTSTPAVPTASESVASTAAAAPPASQVNPAATVTRPITIGYEAIGSSKVMAEVYGKALEEAGFDVQLTVPGQQADFVPAMAAGAVDVLPAYAGVYANYLFQLKNGGADPPVWTDPLDAASAVNDLGALDEIVMLDATPANEAAAFVVTREFSEANGITTLSQMAEWSQRNPLRLGAEETCETRPYCKPNLEKTYGMVVKDFVQLSADGAVVKAALRDDGADLGWLSGVDPAAGSPDLVVLEEDKPLSIVRNIAPVIRRGVATPAVVATLNAVTAKVTNEQLGAMVQAVDSDGSPVGRVASEFIAAQGLGDGRYSGPTKVVGVSVAQPPIATASSAAPPGGPLRISYAPLTDTEIAAHVYAGALEAASIDVELGAPTDPADILAAIPSGEVQMAPMRLNAVASVLNTAVNGPLALPIEARVADRLVARTRDLATPLGMTILDASSASVSSAWSVSSDFVANTGITTLSQLARVSQNRPIRIAAPPPCAERAWCEPFLEDAYGIKVAEFVPLDWGGGLTRGAIDTGSVDVGWLSGNDGGIDEFGFQVLADDQRRASANPIVPVMAADSVTPEIVDVLNAVSAAFSTKDLRRMNQQVEFERRDIDEVVREFLQEHNLG